MSDWITKVLGDLCGTQGGVQTGPFGSQLHAADYVKVGVPSVMPKDIIDGRISDATIARVSQEDIVRLAKYQLREKDIVFSRRGDVERCALITDIEDGWLCGTGCLRVRLDNNSIDSRYAYYFFRTPFAREWIVRHAHGATMLNLNTSILSGLPFKYPPLAEQKRIAHILGSFDDKIELNRKMNETLEAMAQALFKDWFVDFGPTRAKMEGKEPYLAPEIWELFPDKLGEDGVPEGWEMRRLTDFIEIIGGGTPKTKIEEYWGGDIPWFSVADTPPTGSVFVKQTTKSITHSGVNGSSAKLVRPGTTIVSARGTVGNLAIAGREMTFNQSCYGLQGKDKIGDYFVYLLMKHTVDVLRNMAHGSVFSTITRKTFEASSSCMPDNNILAAFEESVSGLFKLILGNVQNNLTLAETRTTLLQELFKYA